ncbi:hypothetical protein [Mobilicoccus massiliensis]|uniref:hypothetical protein n=1 Tax=Mobilicoccus massiliensis TaxID=1522310 RepID=UPI00058BE55D|nr:hypothetical protein [Mobilicoccus massiliensis]
MPRANRRRRDERGLHPGLFVRELREQFDGTTWVVREVTGRDPGRRYVCPGCQQSFSGGSSHVVVWPESGLGAGVSGRRHWHTSCWRARHRRPPRGSYR